MEILIGKFCEKFDLEFIKIELMRRGQRIGDRSKIRVCWVNVCCSWRGTRGSSYGGSLQGDFRSYFAQDVKSHIYPLCP